MSRNQKRMETTHERIKWSPRLRPALLKRLYESDALGLQDDDLCNDVGARLYLRCQTVLMVSRNEVACPRCGASFKVDTSSQGAITLCPTKDCGWQVSLTDYHQSWSKKRIWGANALPAFEEFYERFSIKLPYKEKMLLIDQLIHSFHWSMQQMLPARSAANNLIEGEHDGVIEFLDGLTGIDPARKAEWRETMHRMMKRRKGK
ncbi:MAG TPA: hypothetical protein VFQ23_04220 [Anaerolineales bacterium]|nr:hypothetical protein [Anaerolineales bacterium]